MPDSEPEPFGIEEHLVSASAKLVMLDKLLGAVLPRGSKVLIFSGFTRMLDILEDYLTLRGTAFLRLDGGTSRPRRNLGIRVFQQNDATGPPVFLISTRAGGLGINLTAADTVVLFDSDWNPQVSILYVWGGPGLICPYRSTSKPSPGRTGSAKPDRSRCTVRFEIPCAAASLLRPPRQGSSATKVSSSRCSDVSQRSCTFRSRRANCSHLPSLR